MITLGHIDRQEAVRYLGGAQTGMNEQMDRLCDLAEADILRAAAPKWLYREVPLPFPELMRGDDIVRHLNGCKKALLVCATLGGSVDRLLRITQVTDMARAVVIDAMASAAIEQVCNSMDHELSERYPGWYMTFRFSPGYGDFPIELQQRFLQLLDAPRKIGLTCNDSFLMVPTKSETAVIGLSDHPLKAGVRGCATCRLNGQCQFRKNGEHCGF